MLKYGIVYTVFAVAVVTVAADCPAGFILNLNSCYKLFNNTFTWPESISFCNAFNTNLVTIEDDTELAFLMTKAAEVGGAGFWTGGSDALEQDQWIWTETGEILTLTGKWAPGEPDRTAGKDCLGLWGDHGYLLGAWACNSLLQPICEVSIEGTEVIG
ncbi:perlucin-like [Pecten maximus]|uniref:perlucin-like n=1 Tax=Pecten maximus TaxID=6579 RepID=UPI0014581CFD|nr:perlucin-like [Pecten maximus]